MISKSWIAVAATAVAIIAISALYITGAFTPGPQIVKIGDSVKYGREQQLLITFTGHKRVEILKGREPDDGRVFCIINMTFENVVDKDLSGLDLPVNPGSYFAIRGAVLIADGYEFEDYGSKMMISEIKIGETVDTYIYFEILDDVEPKELRIRDVLILRFLV